MDLFLPASLSSIFDSSHQKFHRCEIAPESPKASFYLAGGDNDVPGERDGTGEEGAFGGAGASGGDGACGGGAAIGSGAAMGADGEGDRKAFCSGLGEARVLVLGVAEGSGFCMRVIDAGDGDDPGGLAAAGISCADIMATWRCRVS